MDAVREFWTGLLSTDVTSDCIDTDTVNLLRCKMPTFSSNDAAEIVELMRSGILFRDVRSEEAREMLQRRVLECDRIITLESFFQDAMYLKACSKSLDTLIPRLKRGKQSMRSALEHHFSGDGVDFSLRYVDLCNFAFRNFPYILGGDHYKRLIAKGAQNSMANAKCCGELTPLGHFARSIGFESPAILDMVETDAGQTYDYVAASKASFSNDVLDLPVQSRCGLPSRRIFRRDRGYITTTNLLAQQEERRAYVSSFAVIRNMIYRFLRDDLGLTARHVSVNRTQDDYIDRPISSNYDLAIRSTSTTPHYTQTSNLKGKWKEGDFAEFHIHPDFMISPMRPDSGLNFYKHKTVQHGQGPLEAALATPEPTGHISIRDRRRALRASSSRSADTTLDLKTPQSSEEPNVYYDGLSSRRSEEMHAVNPMSAKSQAPRDKYESDMSRSERPSSVDKVNECDDRDSRNSQSMVISVDNLASLEQKASKVDPAEWQHENDIYDPEQHILSTAEVVGEVYGADVENGSYAEKSLEIDASDQQHASMENWKRRTVFPGAESKRKGRIFSPGQAAQAGIPDRSQQQTRMPITDQDLTSWLKPSSDSAAAKHMTIFPGASAGMRRKFIADDSTRTIIRSSRSRQAQMPSWDAVRSEVHAVSSIWEKLDYNKLYITSTTELTVLASQRVPGYERLWSWTILDKDTFYAQMEHILAGDFDLQLVASDSHPEGRHVRSVSPKVAWSLAFKHDFTLYPLAIIVPNKRMDENRDKVRRTNGAGKII